MTRADRRTVSWRFPPELVSVVPDGGTTETDPDAPAWNDVKMSVVPTGNAVEVTFRGISTCPPAASEPLQAACPWTDGGDVSAAPAEASAAYASRRPAPYSLSIPTAPQSTAVVISFDFTWAGVSDGFASSISSATPATNGVAMLVPNLTLDSSCVQGPGLTLAHAFAETTPYPGAEMSGFTRAGLPGVASVGPRLENSARAKPYAEVSAIAPTVIAAAAAPGEPTVQAAGPLLPAATTTTIPAAAAAFTALEIASVPSEQPSAPSDRLITRIPYVALLATAQVMPAMTVASVPDPELSSTLIPTSAARGATPGSPVPVPVPAIVAATCVPCPWSSYAVVGVHVA